MKLKKTDKTPEAKRIRSIRRKINKLISDADKVITEHDSYCFKTDRDAADWINSLPIESLRDSLLEEHGYKRNKQSFKDMKRKFALRKEYLQKKEEIERLDIELKQACIDYVLKNVKIIEGILND